MNCNKFRNLKQVRFKVKWWIAIVVLSIFLINTSCNNNCECEDSQNYPSLKIVNKSIDSRSIISINLVGYEFNYLSIPKDSSQTFVLDNGMPGGYSDINVIVRLYSSPGTIVNPVSANIDFSNGAITTVTLNGCVSGEGCKGYSLDSKQ